MGLLLSPALHRCCLRAGIVSLAHYRAFCYVGDVSMFVAVPSYVLHRWPTRPDIFCASASRQIPESILCRQTLAFERRQKTK